MFLFWYKEEDLLTHQFIVVIVVHHQLFLLLMYVLYVYNCHTCCEVESCCLCVQVYMDNRFC